MFLGPTTTGHGGRVVLMSELSMLLITFSIKIHPLLFGKVDITFGDYQLLPESEHLLGGWCMEEFQLLSTYML